MEIFSGIQELRHYIQKTKLQGKTIGLIPTMGALHRGHTELVKTSLRQTDITICSIFINPTQFNNKKDLERYPRDLQSDTAKLRTIGCHAVFAPTIEAMYEKEVLLNIGFGYLEEIMEGKYRPGHFRGVGLVIIKLFNLVEPNRAYFGMKDLQQLVIIRELTKELFFYTDIVPVNTVRESDGLAMSSRNKLLNSKKRKHAADLYNALTIAKRKLNEGESVKSVQNYINEFFRSESPIELEYFEIVRTSDLKKVFEIGSLENISLCIAGYLGKVRLIDNISLI